MLHTRKVSKNSVPIAFDLESKTPIYLDKTDFSKIDPKEIDHKTLLRYYGTSKLRKNFMDQNCRRDLLNRIKEGTLHYGEVSSDTPTIIPMVRHPSTHDNQTSLFYANAPRGGGKTTLAAQMAKLFKALKVPCYVITGSPDPQYEQAGAKYVDIDDLVTTGKDEDLYKEKMIKFKSRKKQLMELDPDRAAELEVKISKLKPKKGDTYKTTDLYEEIKHNACFIFDDWESTMEDKALFLINLIANNERKNGTHLYYISHLATNGHKTRNILNEAYTGHFIVYQSTMPRNMEYLLKSYLSLPLQTIKVIKDLLVSNRWVAIDPLHRALIYPHGVILY